MRPFRAALLLLLAVAGSPSPAWAQLSIYKPYRPAVGEQYHLEMAFGLWNPTPTITFSSDRLAAIGTTIDGVSDLGITRTKFPEAKFVLRLARKHKIRAEYVPVKYSAEAMLTRTIRFQGVDYQVGVMVTSSLDWKAYRVGYEYDLLSRSEGFLGVVAELKYTNMAASLSSPLVSAGVSNVKAPVPALGVIARGYVARNISFTAEVTGFKLPENWWRDRRGSYFDLDLYATANASNNFGVQAGYRSLDVTYRVKGDAGTMKLGGPYLRVVVRF
jgi:hypothetical protein